MSVAETIEMITSLAGGFGVIFGVYTYYKGSKRKTQKATIDVYKELQQNVLVQFNQWEKRKLKHHCRLLLRLQPQKSIN